MNRFEDRTVVITGASRGLGRAMAIGFATEGAHVYIGYLRNEDEAAETLKALPAGSGEPLRFDVTREEEVTAAFAKVHEARKRVDVLINNAGSARDAPALLMDLKDWHEVIAVNLDGAFLCSRAALTPMIHSRRGVIVNVASIAGARANPGQANYTASKGGLLALSRTLAAELAPKGIRVNAVVPGVFGAGMMQRLDHRFRERVLSMVPMGRLGTGEELANAVLFLASDAASYITGCELPVDGGLSA